jgi:hypothetical protein
MSIIVGFQKVISIGTQVGPDLLSLLKKRNQTEKVITFAVNFRTENKSGLQRTFPMLLFFNYPCNLGGMDTVCEETRCPNLGECWVAAILAPPLLPS